MCAPLQFVRCCNKPSKLNFRAKLIGARYWSSTHLHKHEKRIWCCSFKRKPATQKWVGSTLKQVEKQENQLKSTVPFTR